LIEVLTVLAVISILTVSASPSFISLMRDRRVNRAAMQLVDYLRTGRSMAVGRGQPIVVQWNSLGVGGYGSPNPGGTGGIQLVEPIVTTNSAATTCGQTLWGSASTQVVNSFDIQDGYYNYTSITFFDDVGGTPSFSQMCFAPTGRMYLRDGSGGVGSGGFHPVLGVPAFTILNTQTGRPRQVFVPPNGVARIQL
jgi:Tfp pilus assembly protein FimT